VEDSTVRWVRRGGALHIDAPCVPIRAVETPGDEQPNVEGIRIQMSRRRNKVHPVRSDCAVAERCDVTLYS
jgi:hypothetical protein